MNDKVVAGIDIGGTKIAVALETPAGERIAARRFPTEVKLGPERILENISQAVEGMLAESNTNLTALGIGCPGPIDIVRGLVLSPTNLPDWIDFPIVELIRKRFDVPVSLDNDANAAALGEYFYGAGRGFGDVFYVTISTGIGGSIICEGQVHHGVQAGAGEIGHTIVRTNGVRCRCGTHGCLETIASGTGIARRMRETLAAQNGKSAENLDQITAETVVEAVKNGDETAQKIWDETIKYLAIGIGNAITLIAPEAVIIGGGVSEAGELLLEPLRREIGKIVTMVPIEKVQILKASLGSESGVCGALILAANALKNTHENVY
ncbi:MAG TPA: ROK family protein [Pyrinomonadaceae bacterium]|nr:ROK family protein [Pyrinomonadaceae bacterium]